MPTSFAQNIPSIVELMQRVKPKTILDIGVGNGKYGLLAREYIKGVEVDGVEAYEPYISNIQKAIYRKIYTGDVAKLKLNSLPKYDLYLMVDVIEHVPKIVGHRILEQLEGLILVSTPVEDYRAHYENHFEDHVSHWTLEDFKRYHYEDFSNTYSTLVLVDTSRTANKSRADELNQENAQLKERLDAIYNSHSWRITAPLRKLKQRGRR